MDELIARYREMGTNLQDVERQRGALQAQNDKIVQIATQCADQNAKLRDVTTEVLDRYEHMGSFSKATIDEPFTRLTRTRVENLVDDLKNTQFYPPRLENSNVQHASTRLVAFVVTAYNIIPYVNYTLQHSKKGHLI